MKKLYALCYGVILLCIVGTAILLIFTPDTIPVHYNFAGEVDRFGSKYENLIWPIFTISMGAMKFTGIAIGILLVILGNIMPKMRRNAMFGLRTKWSMTNDSVWQKSQRFGGIASVLCGLAMIVISAFVPGVWNLFVMTVIIIVWLILCMIASYRYYKADNTP